MKLLDSFCVAKAKCLNRKLIMKSVLLDISDRFQNNYLFCGKLVESIARVASPGLLMYSRIVALESFYYIYFDKFYKSNYF